MQIKLGMQQRQKLLNLNDALRTKNLELEARIEDLEKGQINCAKSGILIRNVEPLKSESKHTLTNWIKDKFAKVLNVSKEEIIHVERLNNKRNKREKPAANATTSQSGFNRPEVHPGTSTPPVLVKFATMAQKFSFFKNLKNLPKSKDAKAWVVLEEVPRCRQQRKKQLEELAYTRRKSQPGLRTRLSWDNYQLVLEEKPKNASVFSRVNA